MNVGAAACPARWNSIRRTGVTKSLSLEGKAPGAHTGRMRWKCCFSAGSSKVAPVGATIGRPPVSSSDVLRMSDARPYGSSIASLP